MIADLEKSLATANDVLRMGGVPLQPAIRMGPGPRFKSTMARGVFLGP